MRILYQPNEINLYIRQLIRHDRCWHILQDRQGAGGTVDISGSSETTIFAARWKLNTCNVTYNLNGGSGSASAATVDYGSKITVPANPGDTISILSQYISTSICVPAIE